MKYLLILLPFMWGCAEKKPYKVARIVAGLDTIWVSGYSKIDFTSSRLESDSIRYKSADYRLIQLYYHDHCLRVGISIDGPNVWNDSMQLAKDSLPGGHSIHAEPHDNTRKTDQLEKLQAAFDKSYVKYVSPTFSTDSLTRESGLYKTLADTLKKYSKP